MPIVLQLSKKLRSQPEPLVPTGTRLRHFSGSADVGAWLDLRRRAFARQRLGVGNWHEADFRREFLDKPWWRPDVMWFAEVQASPDAAWQLAGTVTLARRGTPPADVPVVHWLAVLPQMRRRGIGRLLMTTLERAVWDQGERHIYLETHSAWIEAAGLYATLGYEPVAK
jgi:GNAT superfamily N-acetyltransferase